MPTCPVLKKPTREWEEANLNGNLDAHAVAAKEASLDHRLVRPVPLVWVPWIDLTKLRQEMTDLEL